MSDPIKHECGLAFIRLRKPFSYYQKKYGTVMWGLNKLYLLMEKQHNRGQDGAGVAAVKLDVEPGYPFLHRIRSTAKFRVVDNHRCRP
jgi:amidophosphoribosyltransferase